jgi:CheY-like chemotaxis protein
MSDYSHLRLLIAEDQAINQFILKKILGKWSIVPAMVYDGEQAIAAFNSAEFDMIFLDVQMPIMGGYQASKEIRAINKEIPIIAISAAVLPTSLEEAQSYGMNEFIGKPYSPEEIFEVIEKFIGKESKPL